MQYKFFESIRIGIEGVKGWVILQLFSFQCCNFLIFFYEEYFCIQSQNYLPPITPIDLFISLFQIFIHQVVVILIDVTKKLVVVGIGCDRSVIIGPGP